MNEGLIASKRTCPICNEEMELEAVRTGRTDTDGNAGNAGMTNAIK